MNENFNLATANKHELKKFAKDSYGLSLTMNMAEDTMRQHIQIYCQDNNLDLPNSEIGNAEKVGTKQAAKKVTINIATSEGKNGAEPIFLGVQGVGYTLPRGINIKVSPAIVEVLRNAEKDVITQDVDSGDLLHNPVLTYPFSVVAA